MNVNTRKKYFCRIIVTIFCLLTIGYGRCCYAGIEKCFYRDGSNYLCFNSSAYSSSKLINLEGAKDIYNFFTSINESIRIVSLLAEDFTPAAFNLIQPILARADSVVFDLSSARVLLEKSHVDDLQLLSVEDQITWLCSSLL